VKTNLQIKSLITFCVFLTACNLNQQRKDAIDARKKSDSIMNEFKKINQHLEQENKKIQEDNFAYNKKMDSLHHVLDSLNASNQ